MGEAVSEGSVLGRFGLGAKARGNWILLQFTGEEVEPLSGIRAIVSV